MFKKVFVVCIIILLGDVTFCFAAENAAKPAPSDQSFSAKLEKTKTLLNERVEKNAQNEIDGEEGLAKWREKPDFGFKESGSRMLQGLAICLGVFLIGSYFAKRFGNNPGCEENCQLAIIARMPITPKTTLLLIEANGHQVLSSVGPDQVSFHKVNTEVKPQPVFDEKLDLVCKEDIKLSA